MVQPAKLNREMIVREAIALLQHGGLEALTLRALAKRLGVSAPSLARHVGDKGHLVAHVSATIFLDALDRIEPGLVGDDWLMAYGRALYEQQRQTRDITALVASNTPHIPELEHLTRQRLVTLMNQAGLAGELAMHQQAAIQALVTGWNAFEKSSRHGGYFARFDQALAALVAGFAAR